MTKTRTANTFAPPVMEARRWLEGLEFGNDKPLMNVSQAAPVEPPPEGLRRAMANAVLTEDAVHLYGPVLGMPSLRAALAERSTSIYGGTVTAHQVAITSGCNQAFAAAIATLCAEDDEVILPTPWYFNHKMWLDMSGVRAIPLSTDQNLLPDPARAAELISPRTRAIVLVTPNNPAGVEYPSALITEFMELAAHHGVALIVDETYRDFHSQAGAPHTLFSQDSWEDTLIHLYSFSKAYRLTGHRVGAILASPQRLTEVEKFLDTVAICPGQVGQHAAIWGLAHLDQWLAGERAEILARRAAIETQAPRLADKGWHLRGCGAYFAYFEHPFDSPSDVLAQRLVRESAVLALPGTMFVPENDTSGARHMRIAFANLDTDGIGRLFDRLEALRP